MARLLFATSAFLIAKISFASSRYNVLYLLSDDMRADLGSYGLPVHTPNLDALASKSILFQHAYCQISVCSPSRQSFMTSLRPDRNKVWNFLDANPKTAQATPGHFRDHGYLSLGLGKTFHEQGGGWNADRYYNITDSNGLPYYHYEPNTCPHGNEGGGQCIVADEKIYDYKLRLKTMDYIKHGAQLYRSTNGSVPFFIMAGFRDPHAPWAAPQRMYDLYNESSVNIPSHKTLGKDIPLISWSPELSICLANGTKFHYWYDRPVPDWVLKNQRRAYYSAVSYVDEHVGEILKVIEEQGIANDTIIVFHSDHGYALGEHGYWEKKSNFDLTVRVPLLIHVPGITDQSGYQTKTKSLIDLVDVFPTLSALAGLPVPKGVDGIDLSDVVRAGSRNYNDTTNHNKMNRRQAAYHQYPACRTPTFNSTRRQCNNVKASEFDFMGYSIRTKRWRYTCWYHWDKKRLEPVWDGDYADELYDHKEDDSSDMDRWENVNLSAKRTDVAHRLKENLEKFFRRSNSTAWDLIERTSVSM